MNITGKTAAMGGIFLSSLILLAIPSVSTSAEPKADKPAASNRINTIKTFDLLTPRVLAHQQMDPKKPAYGSMPIKRESQFYIHEALYGLAWRYNHDLTAELGYKDPWYRNPKLLKSAIAMGEYIISRQIQKGGWGWTKGYVENAFIGRTLAKAYVQLEPYLDDTVKDRKWPKRKTAPEQLLTQKEYWKKSLVTAANAYLRMPLGQNWFVQNQFLVGKHFLLEMYHITGDKRYLDCVLKALNKYTFRYPYTQDGIQGEWNESIRGATKRRVKTLGYDPNYAFTSESALTLIYNLLPEKLAAAERKKIREIMAKHFDTMQYLTMPRENNYYHQAGFGCRGNARKYNFGKVPLDNADTNSDFLLAPFVFAECSPVARKWAAIINEDFNTPSPAYGLSWGRGKNGIPRGHSISWAPHEAHQFIDCYEFWKNYSSDYVLVNDRKEGYLKNLSETKIVAVKTGGYIVNLSYGSATPSGGVIADVYSLAQKKHLFSGRASRFLGLNCLIYEQDGKTASNNFDVKAKCKVLSDKAPYKIQISGTLRHKNQKTVPINYAITYCFKDDAIEITNKLKILKPLEGKLYIVYTPVQTGKAPVISGTTVTGDYWFIIRHVKQSSKHSHVKQSGKRQEAAKAKAGWGKVDVIRMFEQSVAGKTSLTQKYEIRKLRGLSK